MNDSAADRLVFAMKQCVKGYDAQAVKHVLRQVVAQCWPSLPGYSTLDAAKIEETQKASVGVGVAITFREHGVQKVLMLRAGSHYAHAKDTELYMIPGGFANLTHTHGSSLVAASQKPEGLAEGAAREVEEELKLPDGTPLLKVDPARLKPMDTKTLRTGNDVTVVVGMMLELSPKEVAQVKAHVSNIQADPEYAQAVAQQTANPDSGLPEAQGAAIVTLKDLIEKRVPLLHEDQHSLFAALQSHYECYAPSRAR